ncbi:hypothetical protein BASA50_011098 [Batrachochytrium salamandrivorans]|uniref:SPX domain-containing protein n=1 Tax=Batrachochytrium salamandrivorans TaxID=1357716 RepID=A0ABQ8EZN6_9FUNG|nr:hypothetical protein BASA62_009258 [Batrachochytrium salamandrivorans]KAH6571987.1 hypothetical protein BASA60_006878 [Batrachochytrium salamandrivorans]KAH6587796.1 hypothetical protein BASA50_011098 [Batrachochytrium salamandrivorans]
MIVGIGAILSVLSSSVLAAVIPDYDSHGILLVRRAVNPENHAVLWKRNNEEQTGPGPSNPGAGNGDGAGTSNGQSNLDYSSDNRGSNKLKRFLEFLKGIYRSFKISLNTPKQRMTRWRDKRSVKAAIKKVAGVVQGENKSKFTSEIEIYLNSLLESARMTLWLYENKTKARLFFLSIPKGKNKKSLTNEMNRIRTNGKLFIKKHLNFLTISLATITKFPKDVINELERVTNSASDTSAMLKSLHADYTDLILKVGRKNNEGHIKVTDTYRSSLKGYYSGPWKSFHSIVGLLKNGKLKFKGNNPSIFDAHKTRVQKRLGLKSLSSTGRVLSPEETGQQILKPRPPVQQISQQDTSYQGPPNQGTSNQGPPDKDTSKQGPSDEDTSDQDESDPIPAKRRRMMISQETRV